MTTLKTMLVQVDGTHAASKRLAFALEVATRHGASLGVAFAVVPRFVPLPIPAGEGIPTAPLLQEIDGRHRLRARAAFERCCGDAPNVEWLDLAGSDVVERLVRRARLVDCVVLGQFDPDDAAGSDVPPHLIETVLVRSGVPALLVPQLGDTQPDPDSVLIAWKSAPEAARALASALPMLARSSHIHVAVAADAGPQDHDTGTILGFLAAHGVHGVHVHAGVQDGSAGDSLLSLAADTGAGLLVMGCYGHSRAREWLMGGATRTVLASMTLPLWMAH
jgi:nucleotide-binding universal stress UspA family protein